jgi:hypothetical protein
VLVVVLVLVLERLATPRVRSDQERAFVQVMYAV